MEFQVLTSSPYNSNTRRANRQSEDDVDDLVALLYSYSFIIPKTGQDSFAIHAVIHVWSRERLGFEEQTTSMLHSFKSLVHSPYMSTGDGEIYPVSNNDFILQRSTIHHIEYALDVGDEVIGFWPLRASANSLNESQQKLRTSVFESIDNALQGTKFALDYLHPDPKNAHPSPLRRAGIATSAALLKETWNTFAMLSGIVYEQGSYCLSQQFQLRTLAYLLTFSAASFEIGRAHV